MTLFSYKVFITTVEQMSFRKTAEILNLTPSAVSHCISNMEEELGFPLFTRNKNRISLTMDAKNLIPYVRQLLNCENTVNQAIDEIKGLQRGTVKLGCFNSVCTNWIPSLLKEFKKECPGIGVEIFQGSYENIVNWIEAGTIDMGFLSVSAAGNVPVEPLYRDRLMGVVPRGFENEDIEGISVEKLAGYPFVQPMENCDADSQKLLKEHGMSIKSNCHVIDDISLLTMVEAGFGVCILPKLMVECFSAEVDVYPIIPETYRIIGLSCYESSKTVPAVNKLYDFIVERYSEFRKK